jgi:hypothetical protein
MAPLSLRERVRVRGSFDPFLLDRASILFSFPPLLSFLCSAPLEVGFTPDSIRNEAKPPCHLIVKKLWYPERGLGKNPVILREIT